MALSKAEKTSFDEDFLFLATIKSPLSNVLNKIFISDMAFFDRINRTHDLITAVSMAILMVEINPEVVAHG